MTHREKTVIELTCHYVNTCGSIFVVENYCRPSGWTFITFQNDKFLSPKEIHFCASCSLDKSKLPFNLSQVMLEKYYDAKQKPKGKVSKSSKD